MEACDRLLLLLAIGWSILGIPGNYYRLYGNGNGQFWTLLALVMWVALAGVIAFSWVRRRRRLADYGFSFQMGGMVSLAVLAVIHVYLAMSGKLALTATESWAWSACGALMEEIAFRAIAIDKLMLLWDQTRAKTFWAILASATLFTLPHIVSKSVALVPGIFLSSLIMGYLYYKSRSILLPAWIHSVANAGYRGGLLIAAVYCVISLADCALAYGRTQTPRAASSGA